jgi:flavodoxin
MANNLIIYFSRAGENYVNGNIEKLSMGNTEICAKLIQQAVGGDLFEVKTVRAYAENYRECVAQAVKELQSDARPVLIEYLDSIEQYNNIFVCGPCWCGTYPHAIFSQLERLDFTGKKVMTLMTHEGSGLGRCEQDLKKLCKGASFGSSLAIHGADAAKSESIIACWAKNNV